MTTWFIPAGALLLALLAAYIAVRAETRYVLRYLLIAVVVAFGLGFYFIYPTILGRPDPTYPTVDFHMLAMMEEPDHYISMWVATKDGTRLYRFRANERMLQKLRSMTDGKGQGIYFLTGHFEKPGKLGFGNRIPELDVRTPSAPPLPPKTADAPQQ
jgi:hypothetical protein